MPDIGSPASSWEGGTFADGGLTNCAIGIYLNHNRSQEPFAGEPLFYIYGNDINCMYAGVSARYHDMLHIFDNNFLAPEVNAQTNAMAASQPLVYAILLDGCAQASIHHNSCTGSGRYANDNNAFVFLGLKGACTHNVVESNSHNHGGIAYRADLTVAVARRVVSTNPVVLEPAYLPNTNWITPGLVGGKESLVGAFALHKLVADPGGHLNIIPRDGARGPLSYTVAQAQAIPQKRDGMMIWCVNDVGGPTAAFWDGSGGVFRRMQDRAAIAA